MKQYIGLVITWILIVVCTLVVVSYIMTPKLFGYKQVDCTQVVESGGRQYCQVLITPDNEPVVFIKP